LTISHSYSNDFTFTNCLDFSRIKMRKWYGFILYLYNWRLFFISKIFDIQINLIIEMEFVTFSSVFFWCNIKLRLKTAFLKISFHLPVFSVKWSGTHRSTNFTCTDTFIAEEHLDSNIMISQAHGLLVVNKLVMIDDLT